MIWIADYTVVMGPDGPIAINPDAKKRQMLQYIEDFVVPNDCYLWAFNILPLTLLSIKSFWIKLLYTCFCTSASFIFESNFYIGYCCWHFHLLITSLIEVTCCTEQTPLICGLWNCSVTMWLSWTRIDGSNYLSQNDWNYCLWNDCLCHCHCIFYKYRKETNTSAFIITASIFIQK